MEPLRTAAVGVLVGLVGLVAGLALRDAPDLEQPHGARLKRAAPALAGATRESTDRDAAREHELGQLRGELGTLADQVARLSESPPEARVEDGTPADSATAAPRPERDAAFWEERLESQRVLLAAQLEEETFDPEWTAQAEDEIARSLRERALAGTELTESTCGATLCRVAVAFDDEEVLAETLGSLPYVIPWDGMGFIHADRDDATKMILYAAREGESLPALPPLEEAD